MSKYEIHRIKEPRRPELVFYVPHEIRGDCAVIIYPGFGRTPDDYRRAGEMVAEDNMLGVVTEWHDDGIFKERDMIESVYYPADYLRNKIKHKGKVVAAAHSFGADRLLKAAVMDGYCFSCHKYNDKKRFDGVAVIQPPENLLKYIKNHPVLYLGAQLPYIRAPVALFASLSYPALHVRNTQDGEWLTDFIRNESSLFDFIRDAPDGYSTPTQIIYSPGDIHVDYRDAMRAKEELSRKGLAIIEDVPIPKLEPKLTDKNIETLFRHVKLFNMRIAMGEMEPDTSETYQNVFSIETGLRINSKA